MSSRIEIEITSQIDDQQYTWRALGAREPKGTINKSLLPAKTKIGDDFKVEADFLIDGIEILRVLPKRDERKGQETIEVLGSGNENYGVTTQLVKKKKNKKRISMDFLFAGESCFAHLHTFTFFSLFLSVAGVLFPLLSTSCYR